MKSIAHLRKESGLTQRRLADRLNVTVATVSSWERRVHEPSAKQLRSLAEIFSVSMDDIDFERIGERTEQS